MFNASFTAAANPVACRYRPGFTVLSSGYMLMAGGLGCASTEQATIEVYNTATSTWSALSGSLLTARESTSANQLASGLVHSLAVLLFGSCQLCFTVPFRC